jgi:hypothetical protein
LDVIEEMFTGTKTTTVLRMRPDADTTAKPDLSPDTQVFSESDPNVEKFHMYYFDTIPTQGVMFKKNLRQVIQKTDKEALASPFMEKFRQFLPY